MSMISSQCDELRDWACELRKLANGPVNEGFPAREKLFESADAMCQAADTILELRDDLQRANEAVQDAEHDESMAWDRVRKVETENEKLRKLVAEMYEAVKCCCDECWFGYGRNPAKCENENCGYRKEYVAMRELGVRLDG